MVKKSKQNIPSIESVDLNNEPESTFEEEFQEEFCPEIEQEIDQVIENFTQCNVSNRPIESYKDNKVIQKRLEDQHGLNFLSDQETMDQKIQIMINRALEAQRLEFEEKLKNNNNYSGLSEALLNAINKKDFNKFNELDAERIKLNSKLIKDDTLLIQKKWERMMDPTQYPLISLSIPIVINSENEPTDYCRTKLETDEYDRPICRNGRYNTIIYFQGSIDLKPFEIKLADYIKGQTSYPSATVTVPEPIVQIIAQAIKQPYFNPKTKKTCYPPSCRDLQYPKERLVDSNGLMLDIRKYA